MSLVVYRDGRLYADTRAWGGEGSLPPPGAKNKVVYADDSPTPTLTPQGTSCQGGSNCGG